jgi:hypothetical protein
MKILLGWHSFPGGVKPSYLVPHGHEFINPALDGDDFDNAVRTAQAEYDGYRPDVIVGSSRGGAVAMDPDSGSTPAGSRLTGIANPRVPVPCCRF